MPSLIEYSNIVDGRERRAGGGRTLESFDPYTGKPWALIPRCSADDAGAAVEAAYRAFYSPQWRGLTHTARGKLLERLAGLVARDAERLAAIEVRDNGKLLQE